MSIKKYAVLVLVAIILIALCLVAIPSANATPKKIIVPDDYQSIQAAVGNASSGDTVFVRSGIYAGGIALNKPLSLIGEDSKTTTIVGGVTLKELSYASQDRALSTLQGTASHSLNMITSAIKDASTTNSIHVLNANTSLANFIQPSTYAVYINSSDIIISGFTIKGGNYAISGNGSRLQVYGNNLGVCKLSGSYITIANNTQPFALEIGGSFNLITGNVGIITLVSSNSTVTSNVFKGVIMQDANSNIIANNTVSGANEGMLIGFRGKTCSYNLFAGNKVEGAGLWGILMGAGSYNVFYGNMVTNTGGLGHDGYALALGGNGVIAENNLFLQNIFVNNTELWS